MSAPRFSQSEGGGRHPRDRASPPPRFERRASTQYGDGSSRPSDASSYRPGDSRPSDASSYRPGEPYASRPSDARPSDASSYRPSESRPSDAASSYRPGESYAGAPRDAPRAPKAAQDGAPRGGYASRSRGGISTRGERDARESSYPRRWEKDDWGAAGDPDAWNQRRPSPVSTGRARSRSPPIREPRDRDSGMNRRDGPLSASSARSEDANPGGYFARGGSYRGRGRGEYEARGRGRGLIPEERDTYKARSRSRERSWRDRERDYREDREYDRDSDRYRRDAPTRPDSRNSGGSQTNPSTPLTTNPAASAINAERWRENAKPPTPGAETSRRQSFASAYAERPEFRAAGPSRMDAPMQQAPAPTSPPQPPSTFGFGPGRTPGPPASQGIPPGPREDPSAAKPKAQDPILNAPKAPKAELQIPTGPRAGAPFAKRPTGPTTPGHRHDAHHDAPGLQSPSLQRFGQQRPTGPAFAPPSQPRNFGQWTSPTFSSRQAAQDASMGTSTGHEPMTSPTGPHPGIPGKHVPTGPRAQQPSIRASMNRPTEPAAMANARRMSMQPKGPSIMKPMIPTKRDSFGEERPHGDRRPSGGQGDKDTRRASATILGNRDHGSSVGAVYADDGSKMEVESETAGVDGESTGQPDESDEDDLSEEDYEEAERAYMKDIENLEAKRPPSPRHHPELMLLLEELNALEAAAEDLKNGVLPPPPDDEESIPSRLPLGLPSPTSDDAAKKEEDDAIAKLDEASVSEELPIDGLPFLGSRPLTPVSDIGFDEGDLPDAKSFQNVVTALTEEYEKEEAELDAFRDFYLVQYRKFRIQQEKMDDQKVRVEDPPKKAVTPQPPGTEDLGKDAPPPSGRRRDRSAFSTQADENAAIQASKETFEKEQKEREERELQEASEKEQLPDYTREAVIPSMFRESERRADVFVDVNHFVHTDDVLRAFNFYVAPDDFTENEQEMFVEAYVTTPKKWGHIAREISGRSYQECIMHYYLTKKDVQYKLIADRRKTKRGRGRKIAAGKPKTSGLLSNMRENGAPAPDELTDAGRPKRAAAPVSFGESRKNLSDVTGKLTPGRKPNAARASEAGDSSSDKPAGRGSRGGRTAGARREGGRGRGGKSTASTTASGNTSNAEGPAKSAATTSAPLLAPGPSPEKTQNASPRRSKSTERRAEEQRNRELESAQSLANMGAGLGVPATQVGHTEDWRDGRPSMASAPVENRGGAPASRTAPTEPAPVGDRTHLAAASRGSGQGRGPGQVSSYWSVSEVETFHQLIRHYGTDWTSIASLLTTKSQTMVKNYYQRQIEKGKNSELEQIATDANKRNREMGGPPPNPPITAPLQPPQQQQRRRADPGAFAPQASTQRPLAPSVEMAEAEAESRAASQASPYRGSHAHLVPLRQAAQPGAPAIPTTVAEAVHSRPTSQEQPSTRAAVQSGYYPAEARERRVEVEPRPGQPLDQERFATLLSAQHAQVHEAHGVPPREAVDPYGQPRQPLSHPQQSLQPNSMAAGRTPQMPLAELDRGTRPAPYAPKTEHSPPDLRRETSYGHERYRQAAQHSPHASHAPPRPYGDTSRPGSVIQHASAVPPPAEAKPAEKKRSNIMMMLNDDPPEPPAPKAPPPAARPPPQQAPRHASPAPSQQMYQQPAQSAPPPPYARREHIEAPRHHEARHPYDERSYASQAALAHPPTAIPPGPSAADRRDAPPPSWTSALGRSYYEPAPSRHSYAAPPAAASPPSAHSYLAPSRAAAAPRNESPPPSHRAHSRASSYTGGHQPGHTLAPHPYASIAPPSAQPAPPQQAGYGHHGHGHGHGPAPGQAQAQAPAHIPPPPYSQHAGHQGHQSLQPVQPPQARPGTTYMDPLQRDRREEELRRYGSPGVRQGYGGYPPPPGRDERGYERRYDERR